MSASPKQDRRTQLIRLIHVAKRDRQLSDEVYRDVLTRATGKASCSAMTETELDKVMKALKSQGFRVKHSQPKVVATSGKTKAPRNGPRDGQAALITALWLNLWELGVVENNDDKAIDAFVKRQTGVARYSWLTPAQANKVIEALKDWSARKGFIVPTVLDEEVPGLTAKRQLCEAIYKKLRHVADTSECDLEMDYVSRLDADEAEGLARMMGARLREAMARAK